VAYTGEDVCTEVRRGGSLPSSSVTGTADADILAHADAELRDTLVPLMLGVREELYQRVFDVPVVAGTAAYRINKRAALSRINTVQWINGDGSGFNLSRFEPKQIAELCLLSTATGQPYAYYLEGSRVVLYPSPGGTGTLRIRAFVRPGRLILTTEASSTLAISAVSVGATLTTITTAAHGITTTAVRDVIAGTPSFEHLAVDATATQTAATTVTLPNVSFSTPPAVGDYIGLSDVTPMIQLPVELHPALVELTIARLLRALGKSSEAADHSAEAQRMVAVGIQALTPRVDTADRKILGGPHYRNRGARRPW